MKVLVVGSGGREHALCWAIGASPVCDALYCAPGNAGIAADAECVAIAAEDIDGLVAFARDKGIDLVVVGPPKLPIAWANSAANFPAGLYGVYGSIHL